jgi:hypothetical protein
MPRLSLLLSYALLIDALHQPTSPCGRRRGTPPPHRATDSEDEGDFITRVFKRFLPDPSSMGMKRISVETAPEQYYATKARWAASVGSDDANARLFRPTLAQTNFETRAVTCLYDADRDGWSAEAFHAKVDRTGPAVVFCRSRSGGVFGGYNPKGWVNYGEYRGSLAAFLFTWPDGDTAQRPVKLIKVGGAGLAQVDDGGGPRFGADSLVVPLGFDRQNPRLVRCKLGAYYERMPGTDAKSLLPNGASQDELTELIVYTGVYAPGENIPFTDAEPFALN